MATPPNDHYEALGLSRDAKAGDIRRAYDRLEAEFAKDTSPPDPRRDQRVREAFAVLSDPGARDRYDAGLASGMNRPRRKSPVIPIASAVVALAAGIAGWQALKSTVPKAAAARPLAELAQEAGRSLGRVEALEMSGAVRRLGHGVAIEIGVMAVACDRLPPGAQFVVENGARRVSARVALAAESLGLCKLTVDGGGASSPLRVSGAAPAAGEAVFVATLSAAGDGVIAESRVKRAVVEAGRTLIDVESATAPTEGAVLLDGQGRVLGLSITSSRFAALPTAFVAEKALDSAPPAPPPPAKAEGEATAPAVDASKLPPGVTPGQAEAMAKKLRPPPAVPKDL